MSKPSVMPQKNKTAIEKAKRLKSELSAAMKRTDVLTGHVAISLLGRI
jgi:putative exporter of polyketide antibiotics